MIKNIIIALLAIFSIVMIYMWPKSHPVQDSAVAFVIPEIDLGENERITSAEICFQAAVIKSIRNIPPGWTFSLELDPPPNPRLAGSITVGAAALESTKELPFFELGCYSKDLAPGPAKATLEIAKYTGTNEEPRKMTIDLKESTR
jgi:hypothetical protein